MIGILFFLLKIVIGAIGVGVIFGIGYVVYRIGRLIPENKYTTPLKRRIAGGLIIGLVIFIMFYPVFAPGAFHWMTYFNDRIPEWLQFSRQATG